MLRYLFVFGIIALGMLYSLKSPFYALLFYLWNAYFRPEEWVWGNAVRSLDLSWFIGIFLVVSTLLSRERLNLKVRGWSLLLFVFLALDLVSTILSEHTRYAWPYWTDFAKSIVITYLIASLTTTPSRFRLVLMVIGLSLGFEAAKQGWAQFFLNPGAQNANGIAFLGDNNGVAVGMLMLVPILAVLGQTATTKPQRYVFRFLAVGVVYRAISTYSRGGFLACGALVVFSLLRSQRKVRTVLSVAIVAALIVPVMPDAFWARMRTIDAPAEERDPSAASRLHFWQVAVVMANDRPFLGVGHNAYNPSFAKYETPDSRYVAASVHSAWFGVLAELGYPGLGLFVVIVFSALLRCHRVRKLAAKHDAPVELAKYAGALETALGVFAVGGSFVIFQYSEVLWHFIGLSVALDTLAAVKIVEPASRVAVRETLKSLTAEGVTCPG